MDIYDNKNAVSKKTVGNGFLCLLAVVSILYISIFSHFLLAEIGGFIALSVFSCVYSILLSKKCKLSCIIPLPFAVAAIIIPFFIPGYGFSVVTVLKIANVLFALLFSGVLYICANKKACASATFAAVTVVGTLYFAVCVLFIVFSFFGNFYPDTIISAIDKMADFIGNAYGDFFENILIQAGEKPSLAEIKTLTDSIVLTIKATLPSVIIIYAMAFSACAFAIYKFFVRISGAQKECTDNRQIIFNMSAVSAVVFEIVYLIYLGFMIFGGNTAIYAAIMNVVYVMSVPFAYIGLRQLNSKIKTKIPGKFASKIIIAAGVFVLVGLLGPMIFSFIALYGASVELKKRFIPKF